MTVASTDSVSIRDETGIVEVRLKTRALSIEARFGIVDQTKMITAASELARNTLVYGKGGQAVFELLDEGGRRGLRIKFEDKGPGIPDVAWALTDGYTSGGGLGLGLSGSKRLVNEFSIETTVGEGTTVTITRWK